MMQLIFLCLEVTVGQSENMTELVDEIDFFIL